MGITAEILRFAQDDNFFASAACRKVHLDSDARLAPGRVSARASWGAAVLRPYMDVRCFGFLNLGCDFPF